MKQKKIVLRDERTYNILFIYNPILWCTSNGVSHRQYDYIHAHTFKGNSNRMQSIHTVAKRSMFTTHLVMIVLCHIVIKMIVANDSLHKYLSIKIVNNIASKHYKKFHFKLTLHIAQPTPPKTSRPSLIILAII